MASTQAQKQSTSTSLVCSSFLSCSVTLHKRLWPVFPLRVQKLRRLLTPRILDVALTAITPKHLDAMDICYECKNGHLVVNIGCYYWVLLTLGVNMWVLTCGC